MYVVLLKFASNRGAAGQYMEEHNAWVRRGLDDGVFLVVGSLQPNLGGAIVAAGISMAELERYVGEDPFVREGVVTVEVLEITPHQAVESMAFLLDGAA